MKAKLIAIVLLLQFFSCDVEPLKESFPDQSSDSKSTMPIYNSNNINLNPIYDYQGNFMGTDNQGFEGEVLFMDKNIFRILGGYNNGTDNSKKGGIPHQVALHYGLKLHELAKDGISQSESDMINNAITHIVGQTKSPGFRLDDLHNGQTSTNYSWLDNANPANSVFTSSNEGERLGFNKDEIPVSVNGNKMTFNLISTMWTSKGQFTVNNIQNASIHEGQGHIVNHVPGTGKEHAKAYEMQMSHSTWSGTTKEWKAKVTEGYLQQLRD
ncbi:hypothetical protein [Flavobacterium sp. WV_118_3]|uniref:hypothetical protein n=1 Tax=Flavobacterium sp. WV_118_3 TaxID=3151764 RepID=UPI00321B8935